MTLPDADNYFISWKPFVELIINGSKTFEGRVHQGKAAKCMAGQTLCLHNDDEWVLCRVISKDVYDSFESMLLAKGIQNMTPTRDSLQDAVAAYKSYPGWEKVFDCGAVAFGLTVLNSSQE